MENVMLIKVSTDPSELLNEELTLSLEVNSYDFMTIEENEEFQQRIGECANIVRNAILRKVTETKEERNIEFELDEDYMGEM